MTRDAILTFHMTAARRAKIAAGEGIHALIVQAVQKAGWRVNLRDTDDPAGGDGYHLIYNRAVLEPHCLCLRRCYMNPFWRIETSNYRWDWQVASTDFPGGATAEWFLKHWRLRLFGKIPITSSGHIFMPLQGKLTEQCYFQSQSPMEMIATTLAADPSRKIIATLHPRETYSADDLRRLSAFGSQFELTTRPSMEVLASCDYVVTENSAMALTGFFAKKPAVLFAEIDFHHIAGSVPHIGVEAAFGTVHRAHPFASYLHWFFKENAISVMADDAIAQIQARFRDHGWPM